MFRHRNKLWLLLIIVTYLVIAALYASQTPAWQAPDEPAHYNYIHELATTGQFPVLRMGDYDEAYLEVLKSHGFPPERSIAPVRYEAHQPPLYYVLGAGIFRLSGGGLLPLRLLSVALGALFILLVHEIVRSVYPGQPALRLAAAAFVAFLPMHVAQAAAVNNDALAEVILALILLQSIRYIKQSMTGPLPSNRNALMLGLLLGLALITKVSAYVAAPVVLAALLIGWWEIGKSANQQIGKSQSGKATDHALRLTPYASRLTPHAILTFLPALLLALPWYIRNATLYGNLDILARRWHDAVVVGQLRTGELLAQAGLPAVLERFLVWSHDSFWGVFGWMGVWMDSRIYTALLAWTLAVAVGCIGLLARKTNQKSEFRMQKFRGYALALLGLSALATLGIYVSYNLIFVQPQGRYLFPALPAISLAAALGWREALRPATARWAGLILLLAAALAGLWGLTQDGINVWSVFILGGAGLVLLAWSLLLPRLGGAVRPRLAGLAFALPFAGLPILAWLALVAFVLPQLTRIQPAVQACVLVIL